MTPEEAADIAGVTLQSPEDVIKADPMQLAGLLDYISTGVGIPLISDIADREVFRNINTVGSISAERIFDPNEMIRNGEDCSGFMDKNTLDYIKNKDLYAKRDFDD